MAGTGSWLNISPDSDFSVHNLPYGVFTAPHRPARLGVAIGDFVADLAALKSLGLFSEVEEAIFNADSLNNFISLPAELRKKVRKQIHELLTNPDAALRTNTQWLLKQTEVQLLLPVRPPNYTDFYSSIEHATTVGKLFRPDRPLLPNWRHLPIAYHGRASSVIVSGTPVRRPKGQIIVGDASLPEVKHTNELDFELELGCIISQNSTLGKPLTTDEATDFIFGFVLLNDWSARDIQRWEYQPLGPFTSKNFATTISPWVVPKEALGFARVHGPEQSPRPSDYLLTNRMGHFDIDLEVTINPPNASPHSVCRTNSKHLYWSFEQQIAHHTVTGCNLQVADILATGTISGPEAESGGCLLELTKGGKEPIILPNGLKRTYLENHDSVCLRGFSEKNGLRVGFGEAIGAITP